MSSNLTRVKVYTSAYPYFFIYDKRILIFIVNKFQTKAMLTWFCNVLFDFLMEFGDIRSRRFSQTVKHTRRRKERCTLFAELHHLRAAAHSSGDPSEGA